MVFESYKNFKTIFQKHTPILSDDCYIFEKHNKKVVIQKFITFPNLFRFLFDLI